MYFPAPTRKEKTKEVLYKYMIVRETIQVKKELKKMCTVKHIQTLSFSLPV